MRKVYARDRRCLLKIKAPREELAELQFAESVDIDFYERLIDQVASVRLSNEARSLDVEVPPADDSAIWDNDERVRWFTSKGRAHVRKLIDEEKTRRFEQRARWVRLLVPLIAAFLTGVFGIAGTLLGFLLAHKK